MNTINSNVIVNWKEISKQNETDPFQNESIGVNLKKETNFFWILI